MTSKDFLAYYATHFNTVEVDSTFYRIPNKQSVIGWREQTPKDFLFSLKFPMVITHVKMLKDCQNETSIFLDRVALLKEKLGCLLLQFPYAFGNEPLSLLKSYLNNLPKDLRYAVEIRNKKLLNDDFYSILKDNNVVLAWVDSPLMPQIDKLTSDFIYVRWEGDRRKVKGTLGKIEVDRGGDIRLWADKIKPFLSEKVEVFGYFSKYYSGHSPSDANFISKSSVLE